MADNEAQQGLSIKAMPNPSSSYFTLLINTNSSDPVTFRVLNAMGQVVESRGTIATNGSIIIGYNYKPGLYYVEVLQGSERVVLKLVKQ